MLWRGDAEGSNPFAQWTNGGTCDVQASRVAGTCYSVNSNNAVGDSDIQIVTSPVHGAGSTHAWKHIIYQQTAPDGTIRADLGLSQAFMGTVGGTVDGQTQYWHDAFYFPGPSQTWAPWGDWNSISDMHPDQQGPVNNDIYPLSLGVRAFSSTNPLCPCVFFDHSDNRVTNPVNQDETAVAPLVYDQWIDVIFMIRWGTTGPTGTDPGHVTIWSQYPGSGGYKQIFDKSYPTMDSGDDPYWKQALYTGLNGSRTFTNTIIHDGSCRGTSFNAVAGC